MTRLSAICSLIRPAAVIADVGCDHGRVAEYIVRNGLAEVTIASDISERCLDKARARLRGCDGVRFICCDGIKYYCDSAVIAGMGGFTVTDILDGAQMLPTSLVICAHRDVDRVRRALINKSYTITDDVMIEERNRFYSVIRAERADGVRELSELQYLYGAFYADMPPVLKKYLLALQSTYMLAPERNEAKLALLREALRCGEKQ